jgi:chromosome segregation ATPase
MNDETPNNGNLINFIAATVETLRDQVEGMRDQMATKDDLAGLETRLTEKIEVEITAVRGDIEQVHLRLDSIDKTLRARLNEMEVEIARLRSVVYLLVKDRPELLRLLGQPPTSGESHP